VPLVQSPDHLEEVSQRQMAPTGRRQIPPLRDPYEHERILQHTRTPSSQLRHGAARRLPMSTKKKPESGAEFGSSYRNYLLSDQWKRTRRKRLVFAGYRCERCNGAQKDGVILHVHHLTYQRKGNEALEDLIVLCKGCHDHTHDRQERPPIIKNTRDHNAKCKFCDAPIQWDRTKYGKWFPVSNGHPHQCLVNSMTTRNRPRKSRV